MLILNESNWNEVRQQASQLSPLDVDEWYWEIPADLGRGYARGLEVLPGVWLDWAEWKFHRDWLLKVPVHEHLVQCAVFLSGELPNEEGYPTLGGQRSYLSGSGISPSSTAHYSKSQNLVAVGIHLLPEVFTEFFSGIASSNDALFKVLVKQEDWKASFFPTATQAMRRTAQQMMTAPFRGGMRRLYLQEKIFEFLALQLQPILADQRLCDPQPGRKPDTIARIYHAKEILHSRLEQPPALPELARWVGVSDRTLRRGFREMFSTTVVGYLTQQRMKQAELLLRERTCTVAEVANQVGYTHLGHFAAGFKRQFGITPSECLAGRQVAQG